MYSHLIILLVCCFVHKTTCFRYNDETNYNTNLHRFSICGRPFPEYKIKDFDIFDTSDFSRKHIFDFQTEIRKSLLNSNSREDQHLPRNFNKIYTENFISDRSIKRNSTHFCYNDLCMSNSDNIKCDEKFPYYGTFNSYEGSNDVVYMDQIKFKCK